MSDNYPPPVQMVNGELRIDTHNRAFWEMPEQMSAAQYEAGFWSTSDPQHAFFHESGHEAIAKNFYETLSAIPAVCNDPDLFNMEEARRFQSVTLAQDSMSKFMSLELAAKVLTQVGRHALINIPEFLAEIFTGIAVGKEYDAEIMDFYEKWSGTVKVAG